MWRNFLERLQPLMLAGVPVGRIKGIRISLHLILLPIILVMLVAELLIARSLAGVLDLLLLLGVLFSSVLLHELGHCWGAHRIGGKADSILLWPLGGLASIKGADRSPYTEFFVVLMGPAVSLALAVPFTLAWWLLPESMAASPLGFGVLSFVVYGAGVNGMLFVFNMIVPLFPMDCARLIRSFLSMKRDAQQVTYHLCLGGFFVAGAMMSLGWVSLIALESLGLEFGIILLLIAAFGLQSCMEEMRRIEYEHVYRTEFMMEDDPGVQIYERLTGGWRRLWRKPKSVPRPKRKSAAPSAPDPGGDPVFDSLEDELAAAIGREDFARAAEIRDELRSQQAKSSKS